MTEFTFNKALKTKLHEKYRIDTSLPLEEVSDEAITKMLDSYGSDPEVKNRARELLRVILGFPRLRYIGDAQQLTKQVVVHSFPRVDLKPERNAEIFIRFLEPRIVHLSR